MLDENLPTFFIKPSSDNEQQSTIFLGQGGHDLQPEYAVRRPDPKLPESKDCYAVALYDSYNPEVLFAEVLVRPEWTIPSLSQAEIRANNGVTPPQVPVVPNSFTIQLYNPDQQVVIKQIAGSWNSSTHWEFEIPQQTFRQPSVSALDRSRDDPAVAPTTPKISFKWKRDSKLSKDITCLLVGKSTDGKKSKEPDITVAMFRHGKELTVYEPNMHRVEVEDSKGLEVVLLLSATVIRDIFFNLSREMFNISAPPQTPRKNSGGIAIINGRTNTVPPAPGALKPPVQTNNSIPAFQQAPPNPPRTTPSPNSQAAIDAETARLLALLQKEEKELERQERKEEKRIKKMLEEEEKERKRREAEVAKETERLRRQYGVDPVPDPPPMPLRPNLPIRPHPNSRVQNYPPAPQQLPINYSGPYSQPAPIQRPQSAGPIPQQSAPAPPPQKPSKGRRRSGGGSASGPYLQSPNSGLGAFGASLSGFFGTQAERDERRRLLGMPVQGEGERRKVQKKRSVYF